MLQSFTESGIIQENSEEHFEYFVDVMWCGQVWVTLTWDAGEQSSFISGTNDPDQVGFELISPAGQTYSEQPSASGSLEQSYYLPEPEDETSNWGVWTMTIICGDCGDDHGPLGFRTSSDTDSAYSLSLEFQM